jgi:hypothetical protein
MLTFRKHLSSPPVFRWGPCCSSLSVSLLCFLFCLSSFYVLSLILSVCLYCLFLIVQLGFLWRLFIVKKNQPERDEQHGPHLKTGGELRCLRKVSMHASYKIPATYQYLFFLVKKNQQGRQIFVEKEWNTIIEE